MNPVKPFVLKQHEKQSAATQERIKEAIEDGVVPELTDLELQGVVGGGCFNGIGNEGGGGSD